MTNIFGKKLFRIKALVEFGNVKEGDLGGFVEKESNIDDDGNAWISGNAQVYGNACVAGSVQISGNAQVYGNAWISGNAQVYGNACVAENLDYAIVGGFGSEQQTITFFRQKDGSVGAKCGFFYGTLEEFRENVLETHGESKYAQEYLMIADLMELHFAGGCDGNDKDDHSCL